jgi:hypothetical protein
LHYNSEDVGIKLVFKLLISVNLINYKNESSSETPAISGRISYIFTAFEYCVEEL